MMAEAKQARGRRHRTARISQRPLDDGLFKFAGLLLEGETFP